MPEKAVWKSLLSMTVIAVVIALGLGATHRFTQARINDNQQRVWRDTISEITASEDVTWPDDQQGLPSRWLICDDQGRARHLLETMRTRGYAGEIVLLLGLGNAGRLTGIRVLEHRETPGLGDAIESRKSPWLRQLEGLTPATAAGPAARLSIDGGEVDALSGATITSRAVLNAVATRVAAFSITETCDA